MGVGGDKNLSWHCRTQQKTHSRNQALGENNPWGKDKTKTLIVIVVVLVLLGGGYLLTRERDFGNGPFLFEWRPGGGWKGGRWERRTTLCLFPLMYRFCGSREEGAPGPNLLEKLPVTFYTPRSPHRPEGFVPSLWREPCIRAAPAGANQEPAAALPSYRSRRSRHSVALSCLQTVWRYVIINRWRRRQSVLNVCGYNVVGEGEGLHPERWEKAIGEETGSSPIFFPCLC